MKKACILLSALVMSILMFVGCSTPNNDKNLTPIPNGFYEITEASANGKNDPDGFVGYVIEVRDNYLYFQGFNLLNPDGTITSNNEEVSGGTWNNENGNISCKFIITFEGNKFNYSLKAKPFELTEENSKSTISVFNQPGVYPNKTTINMTTDSMGRPLTLEIDCLNDKVTITCPKYKEFEGTYDVKEINATSLPVAYQKCHPENYRFRYFILSKTGTPAPTRVELSCNEYWVKVDSGADFIFVVEDYGNDDSTFTINGPVGLASSIFN